MPINRATNVGVTLTKFSDMSITDVRERLVTAQLSTERVSLLLMVRRGSELILTDHLHLAPSSYMHVLPAGATMVHADLTGIAAMHWHQAAGRTMLCGHSISSHLR